jgi:hypothetical protein
MKQLKTMIGRGMVALAATAAVVAGPTTSAQAAAAPSAVVVQSDSSCRVTWLYCTTGVVRANATFHFIDWKVCTWFKQAYWQVTDVDNGHIVRSGTVPSNSCRSGRISGLYGNYNGTIWDTSFGATMEIDNSLI